MNNEIRLKNGAVIKLIDRNITGEQHMDVKKTYVATTKKEIVAKSIKYYQDKFNSSTMEKPEVESIDITPIMPVQPSEVSPVTNSEEVAPPQLPEIDNITIPNTMEEPKEEMPTVEEIIMPAPLYTEEPVKAEVESVPEASPAMETSVPVSPSIEEQTPAQEEPFFNTMRIDLPSTNQETEPVGPSIESVPEISPVNNTVEEVPLTASPLPSEEPKTESFETPTSSLNFNIPEETVVPKPMPMPAEQEQPVPTPLAEEPFFNTMRINLPNEELTNGAVSTPTSEPAISSQPTDEAPNPFTSIKVETELPTVEPVSLASQEPVVFDASHESNLLNALSDKNVEASNKAMLLNDNSLNNVRDFGEEPAKVNYQPNAKKAGFVNSKLLTVISVLFFLASCGFLVYEIFNFINAKK